MQTTPTPVETSTVYVSSATNRFRIWHNPSGGYSYWQTDIHRPEGWMYWGQSYSLIQAMTNVAITL
jgi:uncharacterized protein YbdZ (MbtH family)